MKLLARLLILPLLFTICATRVSTLYAQKPGQGNLRGQARIDSLLAQLSIAKDDTNKVKLLNAVTLDYNRINPDDGIKYANEALNLAKKLDWQKGIGIANMALGSSYQAKFDPRTIDYYREASKIFEDINDKVSMGAATMNMGNFYYYKSDYSTTMDYYLKALKIFEESGNEAKIEQVTGNIGVVYCIQGNYTKSLEYHLKALKMCEDAGNKEAIATVTGNIGAVYENRKDFPQALEQYSRQLKLEEELENKAGIARVTGNIGGVYLNLGDYENAVIFELNALKIYEQIGDKLGIATICSVLGEVYAKQKNYVASIQYLLNGIKIAQEIGNKETEAVNLWNIGNEFVALASDTPASGTIGNSMSAAAAIELPKGKFDREGEIPESKAARLRKAIDFLQRGLALSTEIQALGIMQSCYYSLSKAYTLAGDYKKAMENTTSYHALKDSVYTKENDEKMVKMQLKYDYDKKTAETQKASELKLQKQRSYTYMGLAGISLLLVFTFVITRNNKLLSKEKNRSDNLLLNILPAEVARELKDKGSADARHFDNVTVLFTDFVNFTQASENMGAQNLIDELHTCFKTFDEITAKYNIEKIKTIGDAYLAVAGLPARDPKHAENIVKAAKEITAFMGDRLAKLGSDRTFQVRIGIHSGSVVAGIVGVKKFAYDIWGDTVNTAARMEQNSEAGKINISQTTYELVKDKFACDYRGELEAKGKGVMKMYYLSTEVNA